jgi:hypothetical protein
MILRGKVAQNTPAQRRFAPICAKKGALRRARLENFERNESRDLVVHAAHATAAAAVAMTATSCRS